MNSVKEKGYNGKRVSCGCFKGLCRRGGALRAVASRSSGHSVGGDEGFMLLPLPCLDPPTMKTPVLEAKHFNHYEFKKIFETVGTL